MERKIEGERVTYLPKLGHRRKRRARGHDLPIKEEGRKSYRRLKIPFPFNKKKSIMKINKNKKIKIKKRKRKAKGATTVSITDS